MHISSINAITPRLQTLVTQSDESSARVTVWLDRETPIEVKLPRPAHLLTDEEWRRATAKESSTRCTLRLVRVSAVPREDVIKIGSFAIVSIQMAADLWLTVADN